MSDNKKILVGDLSANSMFDDIEILLKDKCAPYTTDRIDMYADTLNITADMEVPIECLSQILTADNTIIFSDETDLTVDLITN